MSTASGAAASCGTSSKFWGLYLLLTLGKILRRDKPVVYFEYYLAPGHRLHAPDFPRVLALMERLGYECLPVGGSMAACIAKQGVSGWRS